MNTADFRKELVKIMPGYSWTVHKPGPYSDRSYLKATGIQTSGFNRLSTLQVVRRDKSGAVEYEVKSSGFGTRSPWLSEATAGTLARALRNLQSHYERVGRNYLSYAHALQSGRAGAHRPDEGNESSREEIQQNKEHQMSYSVITPCGNCIKQKEGCTDGVVVTGAVQGIIHAMPFGTGHKGCGSVTLDCNQKVEAPAE